MKSNKELFNFTPEELTTLGGTVERTTPSGTGVGEHVQQYRFELDHNGDPMLFGRATGTQNGCFWSEWESFGVPVEQLL